jgi:hypothetical protein
MVIEDSNLREDIAAALDSTEPEAPAVAPTEAPTEASAEVSAEARIGETQEQADDRARDEKGRFAKSLGEKAPTIKTDGAKPPEAQKPPEVAPVTPEAPVKAKPPASWKPLAREGWDKVPPDIQQEVIRRERETAMALQETAEARQTHQQFQKAIGPYEHLFRSEGVDPMTGINNLMRTTAMLATGPQQTRAQIVAGIIKTYGVDIATLDALLSGQAPQQAPQQQAPQGPIRDPRLDAILQQAEERTRQQATQQLQAIEGEEFFEDVRMDMADILDLASKRGFQMSAQDAYNKAVALHPEVSRIVEQRRAAANQNGSTQRARVAASSVRGNPTAGVAAPSGGSLTDDINAAWDSLNTRR